MDFKEFILSNLRMTAENQHSEINKSVNSIVLQLFWRIGTILKNDTDNNNDFINDVSDKLSPLFGEYMHIDQLILMKKFAEIYDGESMDKVFYFPGWSDIAIFLNNISESVSRKFSVEESISGINSYCSKIAKEYFSGRDRIKFRKLFEPKECLSLSIYDSSIEKFDFDVANNILNEILRAQVRMNYSLNLEFNSFLWNIGDVIFKSFSHFEESISDNTIDNCIKKLNEISPAIFNKRQLLSSIKLVKHYQDPVKFMNISDMISWPYLKVLIEINDTEKHMHICNQLLKREITLSTLKKNISKGLLNSFFEGYTPSKEDNYKLVKVITEKEKQNLSIENYYERTNQNNEYERILNFNIFKNKDLLEFIKSHY